MRAWPVARSIFDVREANERTTSWIMSARACQCRGDTRPARGSKLTQLRFSDSLARTVYEYHPSSAGQFAWGSQALLEGNVGGKRRRET